MRNEDYSSTNTLWFDDIQLKSSFPFLNEDLDKDVVIIGGGLAGITTAYLLSKAGKKVIVLEKAAIGSGMTGFTTAFLTVNVDLDLADLAKSFGKEGAGIVWKSSQEAINLIEKIVKEESIDCEFTRCKAFEYTNLEADVELLRTEKKLANELGFEADFKQKGLPFKNLGFFELGNQAKFHPRKYLMQLAKAAEKNGARIFENSEVLEVKGKNPVEVITSKGKVKAEYAAIMTHIPFNNPMDIQVKLLPYNTYIIEGFFSANLEEAIYWDTDEPYNYFRIDKYEGNPHFILGGKDHKTGEDIKKEGSQFVELTQYFQELFPDAEVNINRRWSGQIIETIDGLPYIGTLPINDKQIVGTGFSGNGMTYGTIAAMLTKDIVLGNKSDWLGIYSPKRVKGFKKLAGVQTNYVKEMVKGHLGKRHAEIANISNDSGAVVRVKGKQIAFYRDEYGKITQLSPVCQHLGCIVGFNDAEKTWDCPCHGSRYTKEGKVINGPTQKPLPKIN